MRAHFDRGLRAGRTLVTVNAGARTDEALAILDRHEMDFGPSGRDRYSLTEPATRAGRSEPNSRSDEARLAGMDASVVGTASRTWLPPRAGSAGLPDRASATRAGSAGAGRTRRTSVRSAVSSKSDRRAEAQVTGEGAWRSPPSCWQIPTSPPGARVKAVRIHATGDAGVLRIEDLPVPQRRPRPGARAHRGGGRQLHRDLPADRALQASAARYRWAPKRPAPSSQSGPGSTPCVPAIGSLRSTCWAPTPSTRWRRRSAWYRCPTG